MKLKVFITLILVGAVIAAAQYFGSVDSTQTSSQRSRNMVMLGTLTPPYTWMDTVNVAGANYGVPDSVKVCEVRFLKPGTYQIKLNKARPRPYVADTSDILRIDLDSIYTSGTTAGCQAGSIRVFGVLE